MGFTAKLPLKGNKAEEQKMHSQQSLICSHFQRTLVPQEKCHHLTLTHPLSQNAEKQANTEVVCEVLRCRYQPTILLTISSVSTLQII